MTLPETLVVDANPILSAVINDNSAASRVFDEFPGRFISTFFTANESLDVLEEIAAKNDLNMALFESAMLLLPIELYPRMAFRATFEKAKAIIRDPDDAELLALAMAFDAPIWTHDRDLLDCGVPTYKTHELLTLLDEYRAAEATEQP